MKKGLKILALIVALALIVGIGIFANGLVGNPISKAIVTMKCRQYLAQQYADTDFVVENISFSFKDTHYYAHIQSPSSIDSRFTLYFDLMGKLVHDSYELNVLQGWNTADRLDKEYRMLTDAVLDSPNFPLTCNIAYGSLFFWQDKPDNYDLELDKQYDIRALGAEMGHLVVYAESDEVTIEKAAECIMTIKEQMEQNNIPFYSLDFVLLEAVEQEKLIERESIRVENFLSSWIYEEGLLERVETMVEQTRQYYEQEVK